jgi:hypothetical protein
VRLERAQGGSQSRLQVALSPQVCSLESAPFFLLSNLISCSCIRAQHPRAPPSSSSIFPPSQLHDPLIVLLVGSLLIGLGYPAHLPTFPPSLRLGVARLFLASGTRPIPTTLTFQSTLAYDLFRVHDSTSRTSQQCHSKRQRQRSGRPERT